LHYDSPTTSATRDKFYKKLKQRESGRLPGLPTIMISAGFDPVWEAAGSEFKTSLIKYLDVLKQTYAYKNSSNCWNLLESFGTV